MSDQTLSADYNGDNPDNYPPITWREYFTRVRAAKIQQRQALVSQRDALNQQIRTASAEISALEALQKTIQENGK